VSEEKTQTIKYSIEILKKCVKNES